MHSTKDGTPPCCDRAPTHPNPHGSRTPSLLGSRGVPWPATPPDACSRSTDRPRLHQKRLGARVWWCGKECIVCAVFPGLVAGCMHAHRGASRARRGGVLAAPGVGSVPVRSGTQSGLRGGRLNARGPPRGAQASHHTHTALSRAWRPAASLLSLSPLPLPLPHSRLPGGRARARGPPRRRVAVSTSSAA